MSIKNKLLSLGIVFFSGSAAFAACNQPSSPVCVSNDAVYEGEESYKICQTEVESYHESSLGYIDCMKEELQKTAEDVQMQIDNISDKTNAVIKEFNCKSGSQEDC